MKRLSLWLLFFAVLGIQSALAQTYKVKGNVVSKSDNEPLIGVSILQKGTTNGVVTDIDGNYELQMRPSQNEIKFEMAFFVSAKKSGKPKLRSVRTCPSP